MTQRMVVRLIHSSHWNCVSFYSYNYLSQWDSSCPVKYKIGLVRCLVNRAFRICSDVKLDGDLELLRAD